MSVLFGYRAARAIVWAEVVMQLERSTANSEEVLNIPILMGPVGTGKTAIGRWVARELGYPLVKINCGESADPTEVSGLPVPWRIKEQGGRPPYMEWVLNRSVHEACESPVVLFFDDIDKAQPLVEGALLGIFGERMVRDRRLHPETVLIAAGNRVHDDVLARRLSESMRTRATIINIEPRLKDFTAYAKEAEGQSAVHPAVLGFLHYKPELLHKHDPEADRFPTPRGWVEVTPYLYRYAPKEDVTQDKGHAAWKLAVTLKCGEPAANDFWAWYEVISKIDVKAILTKGEVTGDLLTEDAAMTAYAMIFAVAQELNARGAKKEYGGFVKFLEALQPEMRVAMLTQLSNKTRAQIAKVLPNTADMLLSDIVAVGE